MVCLEMGSSGLNALCQPTAARRAFPCWDEPLLKATFAVTLVSRVGSVNLSNMPACSEEVYRPGSVPADSWLARKMATLPDAGQWKVTRFETTPPVSQIVFGGSVTGLADQQSRRCQLIS